jgi:hypothetical protein
VNHFVSSGNQTWQWKFDDFPIKASIYRGISQRWHRRVSWTTATATWRTILLP